jgi:hypothetical protein
MTKPNPFQNLSFFEVSDNIPSGNSLDLLNIVITNPKLKSMRYLISEER